MVELAILCEELGYACAPSPFLSNASAGLFIDQRRQPTSSASAGCPGSPPASSAARRRSSPARATGSSRTPRAPPCWCWTTDDGARLVEAGDAEIEPVELIDATRVLRAGPASGGDPLPGDVEAAADRSVVALAAELTGVAQRAMEMAVDYAKERQQFDRPIGAYQAVSHRCAGMLYDVEEARSLTYYAAWCADAEPESLPLAALDGQGPRLRRRLAGDQRRAPGPRRHRLHLGARPPLPAQARQGRRRAARRPSPAPRARRRPGGSRASDSRLLADPRRPRRA